MYPFNFYYTYSSIVTATSATAFSVTVMASTFSAMAINNYFVATVTAGATACRLFIV